MARRGAAGGTGEAGSDEEAGALYVGDFEGFVSRRDELAKRLRARGDSEAADRVRTLRKPSRGAWAVNQLSGREPELRDHVLRAGAALREAHENVLRGEGDHSDLRKAGDEERAAVARALQAVASLAEEAGSGLSPAAAERVRQTLHAVALDEGVRGDFERHRLSTEHEAAGLGGSSLGAPSPARSRSRKRESPKDGQREEARRRRAELKAAEAELRKLERRREQAQREVDSARRAAERAQRDLERASAELEDAASEAERGRTRAEDLREPSS